MIENKLAKLAVGIFLLTLYGCGGGSLDFDSSSSAARSDVGQSSLASLSLSSIALTSSLSASSEMSAASSAVATVPLALTAPAAISREATGVHTVIAVGNAFASGGIEPIQIAHNTPVNGFVVGLTTVTWVATDAKNQTVSGTQQITVTDTRPPSITPPAAISVAPNPNGGLTKVTLADAVAVDLVDGELSVTNDAPAAGFPIGTTMVTWRATDKRGNGASAVQSVTITKAPALLISVPNDLTVEATAIFSIVNVGSAKATGGIGNVAITSNAPTTGFPVGKTAVVWAAKDANNTVTTGTQQITVNDTTPPTITAPANLTLNPTGTLTKATLGNAKATDLVDGNITATNNAPLNGFEAGKTTTVIWTAVDTRGNTKTATQTVTIGPLSSSSSSVKSSSAFNSSSSAISGVSSVMSSSKSPTLSSISSISSSKPLASSSSVSSSKASSSTSTISSISSSSAASADGAALYVSKGCIGCHGEEGKNPSRPIIVANWSRATLITKITDTMPPNNIGSCSGSCANAIADYILSWQKISACTTGDEVMARRLRLLTNYEYANTTNDLLMRKDGTSITALFEADTIIKGFDNNAQGAGVSTNRMSAYWDAAKKLAEDADLSKIMTCSAQATRDQCANSFVPDFGKKSFRRPLTVEEQTSYVSLFKLGTTNDAGARAVIQAMLTSPNFLYRSEIGVKATVDYQLSPYETASLLSYTFIGSMPDAELFTAAANNQLNTATELRAQAARLAATVRANAQFTHFGLQWLAIGNVANLQRDATLYPVFTPAVATAMQTELEMFLQEIFLKSGYKVSDLFDANFTFVNDVLANYYGMTGVGAGDFRKVTANNDRGGLLTTGAVTASYSTFNQSHPIRRGLLVRRNLLCQEFGAPPPNIGEVEPLNPNKPTRERFAAHTANATCGECHQYIDEIGFSFEHFNAVGQFRLTEGNNLPIDSTGSINGLQKMTDTDMYGFTNLKDLSRILAESGRQQTTSCLTTQFHRYMDGVAEPDTCTVNNTLSRWNSKSTDVKDIWLETVASPSFLKRK